MRAPRSGKRAAATRRARQWRSSTSAGRASRPDRRIGYRARVTSTRIAEAGDGTTPEILWSPPSDARERSRMGDYLAWLEASRGLRFEAYDDLWQWSVDQPGPFWRSVWDHFEVIAHAEPTTQLADARMPG